MRPRNKLPATATPLRQVMSKSIQKAIVQHGMPMIHFQKSLSNGMNGNGNKKKKWFHSTIKSFEFPSFS